MATNLDDYKSLDAFEYMCNLFTQYSLPVNYDFFNRFRTGEMPIGLADYTLYNSLKYTAPEISGLWAMYPIPGTLKEDGTIDRTQMDQTGTGVVMLRDAKDQKASWEFIKWWTQAETQTRFAQEMEAVLGKGSCHVLSIRPVGGMVY